MSSTENEAVMQCNTVVILFDLLPNATVGCMSRAIKCFNLMNKVYVCDIVCTRQETKTLSSLYFNWIAFIFGVIVNLMALITLWAMIRTSTVESGFRWMLRMQQKCMSAALNLICISIFLLCWCNWVEQLSDFWGVYRKKNAKCTFHYGIMNTEY